MAKCAESNPLHEDPGTEVQHPLHEDPGTEVQHPLNEDPGTEVQTPLHEDPGTEVLQVYSFDEFQSALTQHENTTHTKYIVLRTKGNVKNKFVPHPSQRLLWDGVIPFVVVGSMQYGCHRGPDNNTYQKKKYAEVKAKKARDDHVFIKSYNLKQPTKKLDCPVVFTVKRIFQFTELKEHPVTNYEKKKHITTIKQKVKSGEMVPGKELFTFILPKINDHQNHVPSRYETKDQPMNEIPVSIGANVVDVDMQGDDSPQADGELNPMSHDRKLLLLKIKAQFQSLQSLAYLLEDQQLQHLNLNLTALIQEAQNKVKCGPNTKHPVFLSTDLSDKRQKKRKPPNPKNKKLTLPSRKKIKRVGAAADELVSCTDQNAELQILLHKTHENLPESEIISIDENVYYFETVTEG